MFEFRKKLLSLICLAISTCISATTYYISSAGNDGSDGLSESTAWKSIAKVNSSFSGFKAGDLILFKRGDTFYGTITIKASGTAGSPIVLGAYGSGAAPVISGFTVISGWTNVGGGIYSKAISPQSAPNMVTVDGVNTPMGRYPDTGWRTIATASGSTQITGTAAELPSSPDWDGAEVVIRKNRWIIDRNKITSHSNQTINYTSSSSYPGEPGYGYFIQNDLETLTTPGEWYYNSGTFYMYFGSVDPNTKTVKVASLDKIISSSSYSYITLQNLDLQGANTRILDLESSSYFKVQDCGLNYSGAYGVYGIYSGGINSNSFIIDGSVINECNESGIELRSQFQNPVISNNTISNIGTLPGMGGSGDGKYIGLSLALTNGGIVEYNHIFNIGYIPVVLQANNAKARNNYIHNYGYIKDDCGAIYTSGSSPFTGREITNNICMYGIGAKEGTPNPYNIGYCQGVYLDFNSTDVLVQGNTCAYMALAGIYIHSSANSIIRNNTCFGNTYSQIYFFSDPNSGYISIRTMTMENNIFVSKGQTEYTLATETNTTDIPSFFTSSVNNIYSRPIDDNSTILTKISGAQTPRTLASWVSYSGQDANSAKAVSLIDNVNKARIEFNATKSNQTIPLDGAYIDVKGTKYSGSITLLPYTSVVLMVDPNPSTPAASPVFVSAAVENAAPVKS